MRKRVLNRKHAQRGSVILPVMLLIMLMSMLGASALSLSYRSYRLSTRMTGFQQAYYVAEASVQMAMESLRAATEKSMSAGLDRENAMLDAGTTLRTAPQPDFEAIQDISAELVSVVVSSVDGEMGFLLTIRGRYGSADHIAEGFMAVYPGGGFGKPKIAEKIE